MSTSSSSLCLCRSHQHSAFIEVVTANVMEQMQWERRQAVTAVCIATFVVGIPAMAASGAIFPSWEAIYGKSFLRLSTTVGPTGLSLWRH